MATYLPEEVVVKILSRVPPKSLIRFKCVSKRWRALIGNPDFLSKNLLNHSIIAQNSNEDDPLRLILFFAQDSATGNLIHSFRYYDSLQCASQTPLNLPSPAPHYHIAASCNGLLCLWDDTVRSDVYLWNPATSSEVKALPAASSHRHTGLRVFPGQVGFGFDSRSNDFKVVRLFQVVEEDGTERAEAQIYSLRCGSWRLLDLCVPNYVNSRTAALDGVFLWYADDDDIIVAFNFTDEEFRTMMFPDARFFGDYGEYTRTVTDLKGYVATMVFPLDERKKYMHLDIWVMIEFGVRESWTRLLSIQLPLHLERPLRFWKNRGLFMENSEGQLVLYDLFAQTETNLHFEGFGRTLKVVDYTLG